MASFCFTGEALPVEGSGQCHQLESPGDADETHEPSGYWHTHKHTTIHMYIDRYNHMYLSIYNLFIYIYIYVYICLSPVYMYMHMCWSLTQEPGHLDDDPLNRSNLPGPRFFAMVHLLNLKCWTHHLYRTCCYTIHIIMWYLYIHTHLYLFFFTYSLYLGISKSRSDPNISYNLFLSKYHHIQWYYDLLQRSPVGRPQDAPFPRDRSMLSMPFSDQSSLPASPQAEFRGLSGYHGMGHSDQDIIVIWYIMT